MLGDRVHVAKRTLQRRARVKRARAGRGVEKVDRLDWIGVAIGLVGVLIIVRPTGALLSAAILFPLSAAICNSLYQLMTRKFSASDSSTTTNFITGLVGTVMMSFALPFFWPAPSLGSSCRRTGVRSPTPQAA